MALKVEMVTFDCANPAKLAGWWAEQFGGTKQELIPGEFTAVIRSEGPRLGFQKVPDPTPGKNRVHLDFSVATLPSCSPRAFRPRTVAPVNAQSWARTTAGWWSSA